MPTSSLKNALMAMAEEAGEILLGYFGSIKSVRRKENPSSVVCDADTAAERSILGHIRDWFPRDNIIAEESGCIHGSSDYTWVVDPLDGTSNFVAGIPWFGVQIGVLRGRSPIAAVIYLPTEQVFYFAEAGHGVFREGRRLKVTRETDLKNVLCAFGLDPNANQRRSRQEVELLRRVLQGVRNTRATNSLIDFCYTLEGRFGGCINLNTKIWDIVPAALMLPEAGGKFTDLRAKEIEFELGDAAVSRTYAVLGASRALHPQLVSLLERHSKLAIKKGGA